MKTSYDSLATAPISLKCGFDKPFKDQFYAMQNTLSANKSKSAIFPNIIHLVLPRLWNDHDVMAHNRFASQGLSEIVTSIPLESLDANEDRRAHLFGYALLSWSARLGDIYRDGIGGREGRPGRFLVWGAIVSRDDSDGYIAAIRENPQVVRTMTDFVLRDIFELPQDVVPRPDYGEFDKVSPKGIGLTTDPLLTKIEETFSLKPDSIA